jgi:hypothetical protein
MVGLADFEAIFQEIENGPQPLLAVHNLPAHTTGLSVDVLAHVDFRDRLTAHNRVDEIRTRFVVPNITALKLGLKKQLAALIPFFKVSDTVTAGLKGLLHFFTVLA